MSKLPLGISQFRTLRQEGYLYVDKTRQLYNLMNSTSMIFLNRPRRFGKSLLLSTLKELYLANRELFNGLWIDTHSDHDWTAYPVVHIDFLSLNFSTPQGFTQGLLYELATIAKHNNLTLTSDSDILLAFKDLIYQLSAKKKVVLLIDEYDAPILKNITNETHVGTIFDVLTSFFGLIKSLEEHFHRVVVTGLSNLGKSLTLSDMNNLSDISASPLAWDLVGYTQEELETFFKREINVLEKLEQCSRPELISKIKSWYNCYRFSSEPSTVYNPTSLHHLFINNAFSDYALQGGTSSFLVTVLEHRFPYSCETENFTNINYSVQFSHTSLTNPDLLGRTGAHRLEQIDLPSLLYQCGYLTIIKYDRPNSLYTIGFTNKETYNALLKNIFVAVVKQSPRSLDDSTYKLKKALQEGDLEAFISYLPPLFAKVPYHLHIKEERYYHSLFQIVAALLKLEPLGELPTDKGRIDSVILTDRYVYIFEIKLNKDPEVALKQIDDKKYYERWLDSYRSIILVGISFKPKKDKLAFTYKSKKIK